MQHEEKYLSCPDLPQYGAMKAACPVRLPYKSVVICFGIVFSFALLGAIAKIALEQVVNWPEVRVTMVGMLIGLVASIVLWFVFSKGVRYSKQGLFVFDGGIHMNEDVKYMISGGHMITFFSSMRSVSIPWRLLTDFSAKEVTRKGQQAVEASVKIPDGRTIILSTELGGQSGAAITTMIEKLGKSKA